MKFINNTLFIALLMLCTQYTVSQVQECGFDRANRELFNTFPDLKMQLDQELTNFDASRLNDECTDIVTIPVVFHYLYDSGNLSQGYSNDSYVINTVLATLNDYFTQNSNAILNLPPAFDGIPTDDGTCIEFCLAQYDHPQNANLYGNDLNRNGTKDADGDGIIDEGQYAINRYDISSTQVTTFEDAYDAGNQNTSVTNYAQAWNDNQYLNIYVLPRLGGPAGYTYLPNGGSPAFNSIFLQKNAANDEYILAHEAGHWLGLAHTWGDYDPLEPALFSCSNNDYWMNSSQPISDTYPQETAADFFTGCNATTDGATPSSCSSVDNLFNVMDYSYCSDLRNNAIHFTNEQAVYMYQCFTQVGSRLSFNNDINLIKCALPVGCTDPLACNYNPLVVDDDGSCAYPDCLGDCLGELTGNSIPGTFCNDGNPATSPDIFDADCNCIGQALPGCTDQNACNFNASAGVDDGSCNPKDCLGNCNGSQTGPSGAGSPCNDGNTSTSNDVFNDDCICMGQLAGCMDANACNYDINATSDNGSCMYPDCENNCIGTMTGSAIAGTSCNDNDASTIDDTYNSACECIGTLTGCTDPNACNYDPAAVIDDESCNPVDCLGNCDGIETGPAINGAPCDNGDPDVEASFDENCDCIEANQECLTTINMNYAGWHMISTFCHPTNDSIEVIFDPVVNNIIQVKDLAGNVYVPSFNNFNSGLYTWNMEQGYLVKTNAPIALTITGGQEVDLAVDYISLQTGWNMIAYWLQGKSYPIDIFNSIENDVIQVKNLNGAYIPSFNYFDSIDTMRMNNGYLIKMNVDNDLFFDANNTVSRPAPSFNSDKNDKLNPKHFTKQISPNPNNATILVMEENNPMNVGDELGVFTQDGILVASFVYQNEMMGGLAYGDDITEDGKDGLEDNEIYVFKIWDAALDQERIVDMNFEQGSKTFVKDDLVAISFKNDASTGINANNTSFGVALNPNPATNEVNFTIDLKNPANVIIEIFNIEGKMIEVVANQKLMAGTNKINHTVDHLNSGMYFYRVTEGQSSFTSKFTIAR